MDLEIKMDDSIPSEKRVPLADPFILCHEGAYYAYGTHSKDGIEVYQSEDLKHWRGGVGRSKERLALHKDDSFGDCGFWAPEIYYVEGRFLMYYTASKRACVAVADNPLGPFIQPVKESLIPDEYSIDSSLFIDDDGKPYLFFARSPNHNGSEIWSMELEQDLMHVIPKTFRCHARPWQPWELKESIINEGPFVLKHNGIYYLTYSGNAQTCSEYGIGCAVSDHIDGIWRKYDDNPILQNCGGLCCVGHHSFFNDTDGNLRIVFHARMAPVPTGQRHTYIGTARFDGNGTHPAHLVIDNNFIIPELIYNDSDT